MRVVGADACTVAPAGRGSGESAGVKRHAEQLGA